MSVLHMSFELTEHGNSIMGILLELTRALQKDTALLQACLPSLAVLAQVSPQHAADAIMDEMLGLCTGLDSLPLSLIGSNSNLFGDLGAIVISTCCQIHTALLALAAREEIRSGWCKLMVICLEHATT